ncbi:hypothetical protein PROFUN_16061 [Planoprotostelium fungivorum]|uniref:Uncharacterized protein n=1 Tax=Planoprotostelium fungivorum TaxID=1890364 RepID=A0A2P6MSA0_9EUKA|nr:hypothetical protein PROFUN_16061 [Planoprotostelium fungivorum]
MPRPTPGGRPRSLGRVVVRDGSALSWVTTLNDGGNNQNDRLFNRGNAMSGAPTITGTNQLPNPPINTGITMKKIMTTAWAASSNRINNEKVVPANPASNPNTSGPEPARSSTRCFQLNPMWDIPHSAGGVYTIVEGRPKRH